MTGRNGRPLLKYKRERGQMGGGQIQTLSRKADLTPNSWQKRCLKAPSLALYSWLALPFPAPRDKPPRLGLLL